MKRAKKTPKPSKPSKKPESVTGTYVYDKDSDRIVKVSDRIPKVAARGGAADASDASDVGPCGRTECGGGSCAA